MTRIMAWIVTRIMTRILCACRGRLGRESRRQKRGPGADDSENLNRMAWMEQMNRMDASDPLPVHGAIYPMPAHYFCNDPAHPKFGQLGTPVGEPSLRSSLYSALVSATMAIAATVRRGLGVASAFEISAGANKSEFALKRNLDSDATTWTGRKGSERRKTRITRPAQ